jgi:hypothetical protein
MAIYEIKRYTDIRLCYCGLKTCFPSMVSGGRTHCKARPIGKWGFLVKDDRKTQRKWRVEAKDIRKRGMLRKVNFKTPVNDNGFSVYGFTTLDIHVLAEVPKPKKGKSIDYL